MIYQAMGIVADGVCRLVDRDAFAAAFAAWPDGDVYATFTSATALRSRQQNAYWHAAIVRPLAAHCKVTARQMHDALTVKLLPDVVMLRDADGSITESVTIGGSTSTLTPNEAANLIDRGDALVLAAGLDTRQAVRASDVPDPRRPCPAGRRHFWFIVGAGNTFKCKHCGAIKHGER